MSNHLLRVYFHQVVVELASPPLPCSTETRSSRPLPQPFHGDRGHLEGDLQDASPPTGVTRVSGHTPPRGRSYATRYRPTVGFYGGVCPDFRVTPVDGSVGTFHGGQASGSGRIASSFTVLQSRGRHRLSLPTRTNVCTHPKSCGRHRRPRRISNSSGTW